MPLGPQRTGRDQIEQHPPLVTQNPPIDGSTVQLQLALTRTPFGIETHHQRTIDVLGGHFWFSVEPQLQAIGGHLDLFQHHRLRVAQAADHHPHQKAEQRQRGKELGEQFRPRVFHIEGRILDALKSESCMFHVILFQPEIPPNTGNIIRLCANSGCSLHLIEPIGFELDDKRLRRAGLDYHEYATLTRHTDLASCLESLGQPRVFAFTTKASRPFFDASFADGDAFLFGPESRGLPAEVLDSLPAEQRLRLPMRPGCRSLNLSNTVAVTVYEGWRQLGFKMD